MRARPPRGCGGEGEFPTKTGAEEKPITYAGLQFNAEVAFSVATVRSNWASDWRTGAWGQRLTAASTGAPIERGVRLRARVVGSLQSMRAWIQECFEVFV